jgi:hypothetical protein
MFLIFGVKKISGITKSKTANSLQNVVKETDAYFHKFERKKVLRNFS